MNFICSECTSQISHLRVKLHEMLRYAHRTQTHRIRIYRLQFGYLSQLHSAVERHAAA